MRRSRICDRVRVFGASGRFRHRYDHDVERASHRHHDRHDDLAADAAGTPGKAREAAADRSRCERRAGPRRLAHSETGDGPRPQDLRAGASARRQPNAPDQGRAGRGRRTGSDREGDSARPVGASGRDDPARRGRLAGQDPLVSSGPQARPEGGRRGSRAARTAAARRQGVDRTTPEAPAHRVPRPHGAEDTEPRSDHGPVRRPQADGAEGEGETHGDRHHARVEPAALLSRPEARPDVPRRNGPVGVPDTARLVRDRGHGAQPVVVSARLRVGEG